MHMARALFLLVALTGVQGKPGWLVCCWKMTSKQSVPSSVLKPPSFPAGRGLPSACESACKGTCGLALRALAYATHVPGVFDYYLGQWRQQ